MPWRRKWQPTPVFLPGEFHGQRSWQATVHRIVGHNLATTPPPPPKSLQMVTAALKLKDTCSLEENLWPTSVSSVQFSSVTQSRLTLYDPMNHSTPGLSVHHQLQEFTQTHVYRVDNAIQPSHPLLSPSPPAFSLSQHQGLFQGVSSSHQVARVLEFQFQHQSSQWMFRTDFL